jgi:hypothetical protein
MRAACAAPEPVESVPRQEYKALMEKKDIVEKDKQKIMAVINELEQKKIEALRSTWAKERGSGVRTVPHDVEAWLIRPDTLGR